MKTHYPDGRTEERELGYDYERTPKRVAPQIRELLGPNAADVLRRYLDSMKQEAKHG